MKKILVVLIGMLFFGIAITAAIQGLPLQHQQGLTTLPSAGSFAGTIKPQLHGNTTIGTFSGSYAKRNHGGRFTGEWDIAWQNTSASGTMKGVFARLFLFGRITITETNRRVPIVGFLHVTNETFVGRFMAPVGPALYFLGTITS